METDQYDVVIIGTGPGGEGAAMQAAKSGHKKVAIIERFAKVGGGCTHWGTIPSKALRYQIWRYLDVKNNPLFHNAVVDVEVTFKDLLKHATTVINRQVKMRRGFYERNNVELIHGHAAFIDDHSIAVSGPDGAMRRIEADNFVIAVGSRPYRPENVDFSHARVHDSDSILSLEFMPQSVTIYGAGVIGCEYASIFKNLGVKINLINTRDRLLSFLDDEIVDALNYHLRELGAVVRHNEEYSSVETCDDGAILNLKSGKRIKSDVLLWAAGRQGNLDMLGLDNIGLESNSRGHVPVNGNYQTEKKHIYAVGDVVGF
ncbi:MAG: FAD-dependent oxidoreductase, partial [Planctomycetes bacterium]|nr:FAD-dependent oxidoreductase [Planctomycetota bacterium]